VGHGLTLRRDGRRDVAPADVSQSFRHERFAESKAPGHDGETESFLNCQTSPRQGYRRLGTRFAEKEDRHHDHVGQDSIIEIVGSSVRVEGSLYRGCEGDHEAHAEGMGIHVRGGILQRTSVSVTCIEGVQS
jgi:hypothetical protein